MGHYMCEQYFSNTGPAVTALKLGKANLVCMGHYMCEQYFCNTGLAVTALNTGKANLV